MHDRKERVLALIHGAIARYIQHEANTDPLITVTRLTMSPDLKRATVYFTTIPDEKESAALIFLKRSATNIRTMLKRETKLKFIPHLEFEVDYGERNRQHLDEIVSGQ